MTALAAPGGVVGRLTALAAPGGVVGGGPCLRTVPPADSLPKTTIDGHASGGEIRLPGTTIDGHEGDGEIRVYRRPRSLGDVLDLAWAGLRAEMPVACPVCDGRMEPRPTATGHAGGRCRDCSAELS